MPKTEPKLYVIATPLGNRRDITLRAIDSFRVISYFFAEDSRELKKLFGLLDIALQNKKILSFAKHNMKMATERALDLLAQGHDVGLTTDRGTPAISDPGGLLIAQARAQGYSVVPIPGPCSVSTAVSVSGVEGDRFLFLGFLPNTEKAKKELLESIRSLPFTICFFESPKRIRKTVQLLKRCFPMGRLFVGREMTKAFETYQVFLLSTLEITDLPERGEYTVVLEPGEIEKPADDVVEMELAMRTCSDKAWSKQLAKRVEVSAKTLYDALQKRKRRM